MIIVLLLFFKSICLYCQRLVLHIHDRWINPKNVRLLKEATEAKGAKFQVEEYRQVRKTKKRRYYVTNSSTSPLSNTLPDIDTCRFCANTPQGYCRHHFHLQELHVQKQQKQQKFWCPLSSVVAGSNRSAEHRELRQIKRELKRNIQQQQQLKSAQTSTILYEHSTHTKNYPPPPPSSTLTTPYQPLSESSSHFISDSGYQTVSLNSSSTLASEENFEHTEKQPQSDFSSGVATNSSHDCMDMKLPSASSISLAETTYNFETCCETPYHSPFSSIPSTTKLFTNIVSCEYSTLSTSYL